MFPSSVSNIFVYLSAWFMLVEYQAFSAQPANPDPIPSFDEELITIDHIPSPTLGRVNCIVRDALGFLWFGTTRGLCRYDGYEARVFPNGPDLKSRQQVITAMAALDDSLLLLGTSQGMWTFHLATQTFAPFLPGSMLWGSAVNAITKDSHVWIATAIGLFRYDPLDKSLRQLSTKDGMSDNRVTSMLIDRSGRIWIGTLVGLNVFDRATSCFVHFVHDASVLRSLSSAHITSLWESDAGELWVGTNNGVHVVRFASGRLQRVAVQRFARHRISSLAQDPSGRMWLAVSERGLFGYAHGQFTQFRSPNNTDHDLTWVKVLYPDPIASDRENLLLWTGTRYGVNKVITTRNRFRSYSRNLRSLQLDRGAVLTLCEDRSGVLWVGLWGGGLNGFRKLNGRYQRVARFAHNPADRNSLPHNDVLNLLEDRLGRLWIGTSGGLAVLDRERRHMTVHKRVQSDSTSLLDDNIHSLLEDGSGTLWVTTHRGLSALIQETPLRFRHFLRLTADHPPAAGNFFTGTFVDGESNLWVGVHGQGLYKLARNGSIKQFRHAGDSLGTRENGVNTIHKGADDNFWLGTVAGPVLFDPHAGRFTPMHIEQLYDAYIYGIVEDRQADLWMSTSTGLVKFNPNTRAFTRFTEKHGIPFKELHSSFHRSPRGTLLVGSLDGFLEFYPDSPPLSSLAPPIVLTSFSVFDKELPAAVLAAGVINLPHDQNFFSISFAALDYTDPRQNRFVYMLEGMDEKWVDAGTRNYARYTDVGPGSYLFRVRGTNSYNVWNESGTTIAIIIAPPYWRTWWFRIAGLAFIVLLLYSAYRYRLRRVLEVERLRVRIADDLHDDVGSNLSTIAMVSRSLQRVPDLPAAIKQKLSEIYDTALATSEGMKDTVWFIKPKDDTLDDMVLRMKDTTSSLLTDTDYEFHTFMDGKDTRVTIDSKRNFFLAFKEILTNIVKHASATKVEIHINRRGDLLEMTVGDNGRGFDPLAEGMARRGNGLSSLISRANAMGGLCEVLSRPGEGTLVRFSGRLQKK